VDLTKPSQVKALLADLDFRPSRLAGQNFLIDRNILEITLDAAGAANGDFVLEVGPGIGVLTQGLLDRGARVHAVELDRMLAGYLRRRFASREGLTIEQADIVKVDLAERLSRGINKVVANLPYSVGSRFLVDLTAADPGLSCIVVMLQQEVARRILAEPGTKAYGLLGAWIRMTHAARLVKTVQPTCFYPRPRVTSALLRLQRLNPPPVPLEDPDHGLRLLHQAFSQRRKQLGTILASSPVLEELGIDPRTRPEQVPPLQWAALSNALSSAR
jgi:16S rRNA (adenine1518-N6/adenine1519-N6)-dimethyltransferase